MIADAPLRLPADRPAFAWATWRLTVLFAVGVLAARIVYLIWLCPYQLAADEAQYWDWSRRLDLSYYSKGPGVAWAIAASTRPFGVSEWAVRLPAALAAFISTLVLARLAMACTKGNPRVGFVAALLFTLTPIFYGTSQFMTIDAPYITCWIVAAWLAWLVAGAAQEGRSSFRLWALLGAALGLGFLFKYTMLLLIPGLLAFAWQQKLPPAARWTRRLGGLVAAMAFGVAVSPVFIWNTRHGWPTLAHLLGHVGMPGGDVEPRHGWAYNPLWTVGYLLSPFVFLGPPAALLIGFALRRCWQQRKLNGPDEPAIRFALATALPVILF